MKRRYEVLIDTFLAERRESENGGWAEVKPEDLGLLDKIIRQLIKDKFELDAENCPPLEIEIIDRNTHEHMHFRPVEYNHKPRTREQLDKVVEQILFNLRCATEAATRIMDIRRFFIEQEKEKAKKKQTVTSPKSV